jgi:hypothetical protein
VDDERDIMTLYGEHIASTHTKNKYKQREQSQPTAYAQKAHTQTAALFLSSI